MAQEACAIVGQIRFEEQQTVWANEVEDELAREYQAEVYPGMMFTLAKKRMEGTKLWQIMKKMPKGALLHCHLEAMVDQDWLFREALETEGMHISAPEPLHTKEARTSVLFSFHYKSSQPPSDASIWTSKYVADSPVPMKAAADGFPDGGREAFITWLCSRCSISPKESISHHHGTCSIWAKFTSCFIILKTLIYYEPIYRKALARVFGQLARDNIQYVELRAAFAFQYFMGDSEDPMADGEGSIQAIRVLGEEIEKFKATEGSKDFWGARMIWTSIRSFSNREIVQSKWSPTLPIEVFPAIIHHRILTKIQA